MSPVSNPRVVPLPPCYRPPGAMSAPAIEVRPLAHSAIKSEYTLPEALRSVGDD